MFLVILVHDAILSPVSNNTCIQELHNIHVDAHTIEIYRKNIAWISCVCVLYIYHHIYIYIYVYLYLLFFGWYLFVPHESASFNPKSAEKWKHSVPKIAASHLVVWNMGALALAWGPRYEKMVKTIMGIWNHRILKSYSFFVGSETRW